MRVLLLALALLIAGCADDAASAQDDDDFDVDVEVDKDTGGIRGVVVDSTIVPVPDATVKLTSTDPPLETLSDAEGRFAFSKVVPGSHVVEVSKYGFEAVQSSVEVKAGEAQPPVVRIQIQQTYSQAPYSMPFTFDGQIVCSYSASAGITGITAPCVTDYTSLVCPGGCAPALREVQGDSRDWVQEIQSGWKTHMIEMTWDPSAQGTSDQLGFTVSHTERTAYHWYASFGGDNPVVARIDCCEPHPSRQQADGIPEEGLPNLLTFANVRGSGPFSLALQQDFQVITHTFYHLAAPEGWSFINGDEPPF